jgi:hypothetical protein
MWGQHMCQCPTPEINARRVRGIEHTMQFLTMSELWRKPMQVELNEQELVKLVGLVTADMVNELKKNPNLERASTEELARKLRDAYTEEEKRAGK